VKRSHVILIVIGIQAVAMLLLALLGRMVGGSLSGISLTMFAFAYLIPIVAAFIANARFAFVPSLGFLSRVGRLFTSVFLALIGHVVSVVALQLTDPWSRTFALRHRFPTEIREATDSGAVTFIPQNYDDWNYENIATAVWLQGGLYVRHVVYSRGAMFAFTTSGLVFILEGAEGRDPCCWSGWSWWLGNPHEFQFPKRWYGAS
jgi:hypothetical protein